MVAFNGKWVEVALVRKNDYGCLFPCKLPEAWHISIDDIIKEENE